MRLRKEGWADEISGVAKNFPASGHLGPIVFGNIEIGGDLGEMLFADQWPDFSGRIEWVADFDLIDPLN